MSAWADQARMKSHTIGFVPTMGALHEGHLALVKRAAAICDKVVVSIFVNPTQFGPGEDFDAYPRDLDGDLQKLAALRVDIVFAPTSAEMYQAGLTTVHVDALTLPLCGARRPGHFDGVLRVVLKLLNLVRPTRAYFGKKDAQQLYLIKNMVTTLFLPVEIIPCEIIREEDGLALSSRNVYLSKEERVESLKLSKALKNATSQVMRKELSSTHIEAQMRETLSPLTVDYACVLNRHFEPIETVQIGNTMILVAARLGNTRLIDNIWI